jgi:hypothetical protein
VWLSCNYAQVGIGTNQPQTTLDVRATNHNGALTAKDGVLVPRVNAIAANGTEIGQLVYLTANDTANNLQQGFYFWDGTTWQSIASGGGAAAADGTGKIYTGYWYIGDVDASNTSVTDIRGAITSVTHNASLSTGTASTYDVVLDAAYLTGSLGVDFQIVSELQSSRNTNQLDYDTRAHRVFEITANNAFRVTLSNRQSNTTEIGFAFAILRNSLDKTLSQPITNLGVYTSLSALNTAFASPNNLQRATLSTYDATLTHIHGATVPTNEAEYYIAYNGTAWQYIGWSNSGTNFTPPNWQTDTAGVIITATGTNPTKATTVDIDRVRYREYPNNWVEVEMLYAADNRSGASSGSGEYLFTLPNNYQMDANEHPVFTGNGVGSNSVASAYALPINQSLTAQASNNGSEILPIPYNATQFRALTFSGVSTNLYIRSNRYELGQNNKVFYMRFFFKKQ